MCDRFKMSMKAFYDSATQPTHAQPAAGTVPNQGYNLNTFNLFLGQCYY